MKFHILLATTSMLALAACGGSGDNDLGGGGGGDGDVDNPTPDPTVIDPATLPVAGDQTCGGFVCSGQIEGIEFDGTTLTLTGLPFDDDPDGAVFTQVATLTATETTIPAGFGRDFAIYENTDNVPIPGFSRYLAVFQETSGGEITIGVAAIEGYQTFGYSGAWYDVDELTTAIPDNGLVEFAGSYAGTHTYDGNGSLYLTDGEVTMQVDFTDSKLRGFISDRDVFSLDPVTYARTDVRELPNLTLNDSNITGSTFSGTANSYEGAEVFESGTYQGFFGGTSEVGGDVMGGLVQVFAPDYDFDGDGDGDPDPDDDEVNARDLGAFTADRVPFPAP